MSRKIPNDYKHAIRASKKTIFDDIDVGDPDLWIPTHQLETLLNEGLQGKQFVDELGRELPNRTRSKFAKSYVCEALGYPIPSSFKKVQPRFFGQKLDIYVQKSMNLQIWNEELSPTRRYAIIKLSEDNFIMKVKVVSGKELAYLDTTGTITTKYQARLEIGSHTHELVSNEDTTPLLTHVNINSKFDLSVSPIDEPTSGSLLPINEIFIRLSSLVGESFPDPGMDQERNRGAALHKLVCNHLGYSNYEDNGQFPDIRHQLLEIKLQTSPTIDLGLVLPNSKDILDIKKLGDHYPRHCDTRYAMFYANTNGKKVTLTHLFVTTGNDFFTRFRRFEGNVKNGKIQIPLPRNFFL